MRAKVKVDKVDPLAEKRAAKTAPTVTTVPTFGDMADAYVATHEGSWRNPKHRRQWVKTLGEYCAKIRDLPVDGPCVALRRSTTDGSIQISRSPVAVTSAL